MDCCGHGHVFAPQPWVWSTPLVSVGAMLAGAVGPHGSTEAAETAETAALALAVLRSSISVDVHSQAAAPALHQRRRRTAISQTQCGRGRWRWRASPTCQTGPCSHAAPRAVLRQFERRHQVSFTATTSIASPGWTSGIRSGTAEVSRSAT